MISPVILNFFKKQNFTRDDLKKIWLEIMKDSINIIHQLLHSLINLSRFPTLTLFFIMYPFIFYIVTKNQNNFFFITYIYTNTNTLIIIILYHVPTISLIILLCH